MTSTAVALGDPWLVALLAAGAVLLFVAGSRRGRWSLWVAGYFLALGALAAALSPTDRQAPSVGAPPDAAPVGRNPATVAGFSEVTIHQPDRRQRS